MWFLFHRATPSERENFQSRHFNTNCNQVFSTLQKNSKKIPHYASDRGVAAIHFELIVNASQIQYILHTHKPYKGHGNNRT